MSEFTFKKQQMLLNTWTKGRWPDSNRRLCGKQTVHDNILHRTTQYRKIRPLAHRVNHYTTGGFPWLVFLALEFQRPLTFRADNVGASPMMG